MDEIITAKLQEWSKKETGYQIIIALLAVIMIVSFMTKHFDSFIKALPSIQKAWGYAQKKWFSQAIFRSDVLRYMDNNQLHNNLMKNEVQAIRDELAEVKAELKHNGGSTVKDMVKTLVVEVKHLKGLREISDKYDSKMNFKYDPEQGVTFISESFLTAFGCKESDVMFYSFAELIEPSDRAEMWEKWQRACEKKTPFNDVQRVRDQTNNYIECEVKAIPIVIDGKIKEFKGVIEIVYK